MKGVLGSLKTILGDEHNTSKNNLIDNDSEDSGHNLQRTLTNMRVQKLKEVFLDKIGRSNIFIEPTKFHIMSEQDKDNMRFFKCQGFTINEYVLSFIFMLDIIFTLLTFLIGSFLAFLDNFRLEAADSVTVIILLLIAIIATVLKMIASSVGKTIKDGIFLIYITDIMTSYFLSLFVFVDIAMVILLLATLGTSNDYSGLGLAIFIVSMIKLVTLYENLRVIETTFVNSFKKEQYWNLIKVILFNIFFAHFLASLLHAMTKIDENDNWLVSNSIQN